MILYMRNPKDSIRKPFRIINEFNKVAVHRINIKYQLCSYILTINYLKGKLYNNFIYNSTRKNKILRDKLK